MSREKGDYITNWDKGQNFDPSDIYNQLKKDYAAKYDNLEESEIDDYLNRIAYHESKGEWNAIQKVNDKYDKEGNVISLKDGPGRGLFQFEIGKGGGAQTAIQRFKNYYKDDPAMSKVNIPEDFSTLPPDMQKALFMTNMMYIPNRGGDHVEANLSSVKKHGDKGLENFWINYHWAGYKVDPDSTEARRASWNKDQEIYDKRILD